MQQCGQGDRKFVKWARMSIKELCSHSLHKEMEAARLQQEFSRDPQRLPLVQNKVSIVQNKVNFVALSAQLKKPSNLVILQQYY